MNKIIFGVFLSLLASISTYGMGFGNGDNNGQSFGSPKLRPICVGLGSNMEQRKRKNDSGIEEEFQRYKNGRCKEYSSESFFVENRNSGAYNEYTLSHQQSSNNANLLNQIATLSHNVNQLNQIICEIMQGTGQVDQRMLGINGRGPAQFMSNMVPAFGQPIQQMLGINGRSFAQPMSNTGQGFGQTDQQMLGINGRSFAQPMSNTVPAFGQPIQQMYVDTEDCVYPAQFMSNTVPASGQPIQQIYVDTEDCVYPAQFMPNTGQGFGQTDQQMYVDTEDRVYPAQSMPLANQQVPNKVTKEAHNKVKWENPFKKDMFSELTPAYIKIFNKVWDKSFYKFREITNEQQVTTMITPQEVATEYVKFVNNDLEKALKKEAIKRVKEWLKKYAISLESDLDKLGDEKEKWGDLFNDNIFPGLHPRYIKVFKYVWNRYFHKLEENEDPQKVADRYILFVKKELKDIITELAKRKIAIWLVSLKDLLEVDPVKFKEQPEIFGLNKYETGDSFFTLGGKDFGNATWYPRFYYSLNTTGPVLDNFIRGCLNEYIIKDLNNCHEGNRSIKNRKSVQKHRGYKFAGFEKENGEEYTGALSENSFEEIRKELAYNYSNSLYVWLIALKRPRDLECFKKSYKWYENKDDETIAKFKFRDFVDMLKTAKEKDKKKTETAEISTNILEEIPENERD